jgi:glycerol-3-phosphate dehydrogenase (NAD(P)+)
MSEITIIGGGSWGLAMALMLCNNSHKVRVWEYSKKNVEILQKTRTNNDYLKDIYFPEDIVFTNDVAETFCNNPELVILSVPSSYLRKTLELHKENFKSINERNFKAIVNLAKGLEEGSLKRMSEVIKDELPINLHKKICSLSGPSHAEEVACKIPTAVVVAGENEATLQYVQTEFSNINFRVYTSLDIVGVEIGAAVKNIIAIAAGVVDGLSFGDNTKGALLTRGLAEIQRLGQALNANPETFAGLSGLGDLVTTAISQHSRNRFVGYHLGKGRKLSEILSEMVMVAEGVVTTKNIRALKEKLNVSMPITEEMYQVLFNNKNPKDALIDLMSRDLKSENEDRI